MANKLIKYNDIYRQTDNADICCDFSLYKPIRGSVNIYLNDKLIEERLENLVILDGRMLTLQKLFNRYNDPSDSDYTNWSITHFGIGAGGTEISSGGVASLLGPALTDSYLYDPIRIKPSDPTYLSSPQMNITNTSIIKTASSTLVVGIGTYFESQFRVGDEIFIPGVSLAQDETRIIDTITDDTNLSVVSQFNYTNTTSDVKRIVPNSCKIIPDNYFTFVANNEHLSYHTTMKMTCVINALSILDEGSSNELSWLTGVQSIKVDEAALYYTDGTSTRLFAHISFPPKYMSLTSKLTIEWSILA